MKYLKKLEEIEERFESLNLQMADPAVISDPELYRKTAKNHRDIDEVVNKFREWKKVAGDLEGSREMLEEADDGVQSDAAPWDGHRAHPNTQVLVGTHESMDLVRAVHVGVALVGYGHTDAESELGVFGPPGLSSQGEG